MEPRPVFFTITQLMPMLQMGERSIREALRRGEIPGRQVCGQWRVPVSAFYAWMGKADTRVPTNGS